ncbi:cell wall metabolism sensor histidine kinase WalK [Cohnella sp. REN36]|uniref:sensor histidine kinase n=1 Tax=Cohnella sp. REN36 TaxID=2887347 RepID=UPI001D141A28|nr:ATP-binding protein [Cohnella sp. REN36]MCC3371515.1 HAMP domain-containing protein [Cohnella sp. REN36]
MNVGRKLFVAMAVLAVAMSLLFVSATNLVVRHSLAAIIDSTKGETLDRWEAELLRDYADEGGSWGGVRARIDRLKAQQPEARIVLLSADRASLYSDAEADSRMVTRLGLQRKIRDDGRTIGYLYYYDPETAVLRKIQIGIAVSVGILLAGAAIALALVALLAAFGISRWLTAPLRRLLPAIDRLGNGELGIAVPVTTTDEYGKVATAFNEMSAQLREAEAVRRHLVADVAHELRTPLAILQGKLDLAQQNGKPVPPETLLPLQDELLRLTRLVDDLQQLSLAEAKKLPLERQPTDVRALLQRILDHVSDDAANKRIEMNLESRTDRATIHADPHRLTQVFLNLIVNAIRYTPPGGAVRVDVEEDKVADRDGLQVTVTDNGPGIAPEHLPHLFDRFYRADGARTRHDGGAGLGLAIAKAFVLAHGGAIDASSRVGTGATFRVRLPYSPPEKSAN